MRWQVKPLSRQKAWNYSEKAQEEARK